VIEHSVYTSANRFNGNNVLDAPVFAPEERDVYSPETLDHRRSARSEMFPSFASIALLWSARAVSRCNL
jgi:hypothetical protein